MRSCMTEIGNIQLLALCPSGVNPTSMDESSALRRELGQRQTEVNDLRASKRRLREALDRLAGKD